MSTTTKATPSLSVLARPSGGFAMLALDQREAMRAMFAQHQQAPVPDEQVADFKIAATQILSSHASAVLIDRQFALDRALDEAAVSPGTALIAAADSLLPGDGELVADSDIDEAVDPAYYRGRGVVALKLLVIYRPDGDPRRRLALVDRFVGRCQDAGLLSIIEPVSRAPHDGRAWDWNDGVLAAARELGSRGAVLYKAEVPYHGEASDGEVSSHCQIISAAVRSPWVVLSSGVAEVAFPRAVELACRAGASGFLAGRAVWSSCIGQPDESRALREQAAPRLRALAEVVDHVVGGR